MSEIDRRGALGAAMLVAGAAAGGQVVQAKAKAPAKPKVAAKPKAAARKPRTA